MIEMILLFVLIAVVVFHLVLWFVRGVLKIDLPAPFDKEGYLSSYLEGHASMEGFNTGFRAMLPWNMPECPPKFTGKDSVGGYNEETDEEAYFYGWQTVGWGVKWVILGLLFNYGIAQPFLGVGLP